MSFPGLASWRGRQKVLDVERRLCPLEMAEVRDADYTVKWIVSKRRTEKKAEWPDAGDSSAGTAEN
jgi:hypothetical protein